MIYCPYKSQAAMVFFSIFMVIFWFVVAGCYLISWDAWALCWAGFGLVSIWLTKEAYDWTKRAVSLEEEGLRIIGGSYSEYRYIPWTELPHACYARSFRGHLFLILSPNALDQKAAKRLANRGANSARLYVDGAVAILLGFHQDRARVREFVERHVARVDNYDYTL